jgi:hypothetical protein
VLIVSLRADESLDDGSRDDEPYRGAASEAHDHAGPARNEITAAMPESDRKRHEEQWKQAQEQVRAALDEAKRHEPAREAYEREQQPCGVAGYVQARRSTHSVADPIESAERNDLSQRDQLPT